MPADRKSPGRVGFDRLAPFYSGLEYLVLGPLLQRVRRDAVGALRPEARILFLGEGNGRALAQALQSGRGHGGVVADGSGAMLERARRRVAGLPGAGTLTWHRVDLEVDDLAALPLCDACLACFCLDCFPPGDLEAVIRRVDGRLHPDAHWVVADFREPPTPRGWRHWCLRGLYTFFGAATGIRARRACDPGATLNLLGYRRHWEHARADGWLATTVWERKTG